MERFSKVNRAKVVKVIEIRSISGEGTEDDSLRTIVEFFILDGQRLVTQE